MRVILAANLGDDADKTAAICGQVAAVHYGLWSIPQDWIKMLHAASKLRRLADALFCGIPLFPVDVAVKEAR